MELVRLNNKNEDLKKQIQDERKEVIRLKDTLNKQSRQVNEYNRLIKDINRKMIELESLKSNRQELIKDEDKELNLIQCLNDKLNLSRKDFYIKFTNENSK